MALVVAAVREEEENETRRKHAWEFLTKSNRENVEKNVFKRNEKTRAVVCVCVGDHSFCFFLLLFLRGMEICLFSSSSSSSLSSSPSFCAFAFVTSTTFHYFFLVEGDRDKTHSTLTTLPLSPIFLLFLLLFSIPLRLLRFPPRHHAAALTQKNDT